MEVPVFFSSGSEGWSNLGKCASKSQQEMLENCGATPAAAPLEKESMAELEAMLTPDILKGLEDRAHPETRAMMRLTASCNACNVKFEKPLQSELALTGDYNVERTQNNFRALDVVKPSNRNITVAPFSQQYMASYDSPRSKCPAPGWSAGNAESCHIPAEIPSVQYGLLYLLLEKSVEVLRLPQDYARKVLHTYGNVVYDLTPSVPMAIVFLSVVVASLNASSTVESDVCLLVLILFLWALASWHSANTPMPNTLTLFSSLGFFQSSLSPWKTCASRQIKEKGKGLLPHVSSASSNGLLERQRRRQSSPPPPPPAQTAPLLDRRMKHFSKFIPQAVELTSSSATAKLEGGLVIRGDDTSHLLLSDDKILSDDKQEVEKVCSSVESLSLQKTRFTTPAALDRHDNSGKPSVDDVTAGEISMTSLHRPSPSESEDSFLLPSRPRCTSIGKGVARNYTLLTVPSMPSASSTDVGESRDSYCITNNDSNSERDSLLSNSRVSFQNVSSATSRYKVHSQSRKATAVPSNSHLYNVISEAEAFPYKATRPQGAKESKGLSNVATRIAADFPEEHSSYRSDCNDCHLMRRPTDATASTEIGVTSLLNNASMAAASNGAAATGISASSIMGPQLCDRLNGKYQEEQQLLVEAAEHRGAHEVSADGILRHESDDGEELNATCATDCDWQHKTMITGITPTASGDLQDAVHHQLPVSLLPQGTSALDASETDLSSEGETGSFTFPRRTLLDPPQASLKQQDAEMYADLLRSLAQMPTDLLTDDEVSKHSLEEAENGPDAPLGGNAGVPSATPTATEDTPCTLLKSENGARRKFEGTMARARQATVTEEAGACVAYGEGDSVTEPKVTSLERSVESATTLKHYGVKTNSCLVDAFPGLSGRRSSASGKSSGYEGRDCKKSCCAHETGAMDQADASSVSIWGQESTTNSSSHVSCASHVESHAPSPRSSSQRGCQSLSSPLWEESTETPSLGCTCELRGLSSQKLEHREPLAFSRSATIYTPSLKERTSASLGITETHRDTAAPSVTQCPAATLKAAHYITENEMSFLAAAPTSGSDLPTRVKKGLLLERRDPCSVELVSPLGGSQGLSLAPFEGKSLTEDFSQLSLPAAVEVDVAPSSTQEDRTLKGSFRITSSPLAINPEALCGSVVVALRTFLARRGILDETRYARHKGQEESAAEPSTKFSAATAFEFKCGLHNLPQESQTIERQEISELLSMTILHLATETAEALGRWVEVARSSVSCSDGRASLEENSFPALMEGVECFWNFLQQLSDLLDDLDAPTMNEPLWTSACGDTPTPLQIRLRLTLRNLLTGSSLQIALKVTGEIIEILLGRLYRHSSHLSSQSVDGTSGKDCGGQNPSRGCDEGFMLSCTKLRKAEDATVLCKTKGSASGSEFHSLASGDSLGKCSALDKSDKTLKWITAARDALRHLKRGIFVAGPLDPGFSSKIVHCRRGTSADADAPPFGLVDGLLKALCVIGDPQAVELLAFVYQRYLVDATAILEYLDCARRHFWVCEPLALCFYKLARIERGLCKPTREEWDSTFSLATTSAGQIFSDAALLRLVDLLASCQQLEKAYSLLEECANIDNFIFPENLQSLVVKSSLGCGSLANVHKLNETLKTFNAAKTDGKKEEVFAPYTAEISGITGGRIAISLTAQENTLKKLLTSEQTCIEMIRTFGRKGMVSEAFQMLCQIKKSLPSFRHMSDLHSALLEVCVLNQEMTSASELFDTMEKSGLLSREAYELLIKGLCQTIPPDLSRIETLMRRMEVSGFSGNEETSSIVVSAFIMAGELNAAWKIIDRMRKKGQKLDRTVCCAVVKSLRASSPRDRRRIQGIVDEIDVGSDALIFSTVVDACARIKDLPRLKVALKRFRESCPRPNIHAYGPLIKAHGRCGEVDKAVALWTEITETRHMEPTNYTYGCMLDTLVSNGRVTAALDLLKQILDSGREPTTVQYSILIKGCAQEKKIDKAFELYDDMRRRGIEGNEVTYNTLIHTCTSVGDLCKAESVWKDMLQAASCSPDVITYSTLIKGFCTQGKLRRAFELFEEMTKAGIKADAIVFNTLLEGCVRNQEVVKADQLFDKMIASGVAPSSFTLTILMKIYGRSNDLIKALRLFDELPGRYGFEVDAYVYTSLITACLLNGELDLALRYFAKMNSSDCRTSVSGRTYGTVIVGCLRAHRYGAAYKLVCEAYQRNLEITDKTLLVRLSSALSNVPSTGLSEALQRVIRWLKQYVIAVTLRHLPPPPDLPLDIDEMFTAYNNAMIDRRHRPLKKNNESSQVQQLSANQAGRSSTPGSFCSPSRSLSSSSTCPFSVAVGTLPPGNNSPPTSTIWAPPREYQDAPYVENSRHFVCKSFLPQVNIKQVHCATQSPLRNRRIQMPILASSKTAEPSAFSYHDWEAFEGASMEHEGSQRRWEAASGGQKLLSVVQR